MPTQHDSLIQSTRKSVSIADKATESLDTFVSALPPAKFDRPPAAIPPIDDTPDIATIKLLIDLYLFYRRRGVGPQEAEELVHDYHSHKRSSPP